MKRKRPGLVEVLEAMGPQPELADAIEKASKEMRKSRMRRIKL
jgi:predicted CopG family antitoxin